MHFAAIAVVLLALLGCSGEEENATSFERELQSYLETKSRYRHTLDWRGDIETVTCSQPRMILLAPGAKKREPRRFCEIQFSKVGVERWSVIGSDSNALYLFPWGNRGNGVIAN